MIGQIYEPLRLTTSETAECIFRADVNMTSTDQSISFWCVKGATLVVLANLTIFTFWSLFSDTFVSKLDVPTATSRFVFHQDNYHCFFAFLTVLFILGAVGAVFDHVLTLTGFALLFALFAFVSIFFICIELFVALVATLLHEPPYRLHHYVTSAALLMVLLIVVILPSLMVQMLRRDRLVAYKKVPVHIHAAAAKTNGTAANNYNIDHAAKRALDGEHNVSNGDCRLNVDANCVKEININVGEAECQESADDEDDNDSNDDGSTCPIVRRDSGDELFSELYDSIVSCGAEDVDVDSGSDASHRTVITIDTVLTSATEQLLKPSVVVEMNGEANPR